MEQGKSAMPLQKKHNRGKWIIHRVILYFLLLLICCSSAPPSAGLSTPIVSPMRTQLNLPLTDPVPTEPTITAPVDPPPGDWVGYLKDVGRSDFNDAEAL